MSKRINIQEVEPEAFKAMYELVKYLQTSQISHTQQELIKIRASMINGCAFCINMHTKDARKNGETEQRIYLLNAWRETTFYTEEERALLALTEEVTLINHGVSDETYQTAERLFGPNRLAQIIMFIVAINTWNRIAVSTQLQPE
ncbi:carboxymuconolactone decarboxylase family protein [Emticicia sp. 17c]|uniref:carboxymuconolactone decarboxylase family protein n=1 Tax=Emticicia sp. 17c TaxID=3127704 RepID=UPI00301DC928